VSDTVLLDIAHGVARVTLNRPDAMNAITVELGSALRAAIEEAGDRNDVSVVVVRGACGNFSAGGDFREVERLRAEGPDALLPLFANFSAACAMVADIDQPVIAAVDGVAMAGGFELMLAADIVLVHADARISDNHINYGQVPGGGSTQRLPRLIGRQRALSHLLTGERLSGREAVAAGLALRAFEPEDFEAGVEDFLASMVARRPDALRRIKRLVNDGLALPLQRGIDLEQQVVVAHIAGDGGRAGVAAFTEKGAHS